MAIYIYRGAKHEARSDINKISEETIKKYDLIDGSNHAKA